MRAHRKSSWSSGAALVIGALLLSADPGFAGDIANQPRVGGRLIVRARAGLRREALHGALSRYGAARVDGVESLDASIVEVPEAELADVQAALRRSGLFTSVEPDYIARIAEVPDDPYFTSQWALPRIAAPAAWDLATGAGVIVAVVDTGVEASHPDLQGQLLPGYDFFNDDADPDDDNGHGTRMTGIVVARRNNALGAVGVAPDAQVLPVKVLDASGQGPYSAVASGVTYAVDHGARVVNLSLVGSVQSPILQNAVDYAVAHDVVVVAASGNYGTDVPGYPAASPGAVAIAATDDSDTRASFSVYGAWIGFAAPGVDVLTTTLGGGYTGSTGTSPAAAVASGVFALLRSANPLMPRADAIARIEDGAQDLGPDGWDPYYGSGRADAYAALVPGERGSPPPDTAAPTVAILSPTNGTLAWGQVPVDVSANDNVAIARVELYVDGQFYASSTLPPYSFVVDASALAPGQHKLRAYAYDTSGNWSRTRTLKVSFTPGAGLLVTHAVTKAAAITISAQFALPAGTTFDPNRDQMSIELTSAGGTVLAVTASAGSFNVNGSKMQSSIAPAIPASGNVRVTAKHDSDPAIYTLRIKATSLTGMSGRQALMNLALSVGGTQLSQSLGFHAKSADTLVYP